MRRLPVVLAIVVVVVVVVAGCGSEPKARAASDLATTFSASKDYRSVRVYEAYKKTGQVAKTVDVDQPRELMSMRIDCVGGKGDVEVRVGNSAITAECPADNAKGATGRIGAQDLGGETKITVTPKGADLVWSAAVDLYDSKSDRE